MKNDGILDRVAILLLLLHASNLTDEVDQKQAKQAKKPVMAKRVFASEQRREAGEYTIDKKDIFSIMLFPKSRYKRKRDTKVQGIQRKPLDTCSSFHPMSWSTDGGNRLGTLVLSFKLLVSLGCLGRRRNASQLQLTEVIVMKTSLTIGQLTEHSHSLM